MKKTGRNDPCPCGSGRKYKKCCLNRRQPAPVGNLIWQKMRRTEGELIPKLLKHCARFYSPEAIYEAWHDYNLGEEIPLEPEVEPDVDQMFLPWALFNWIPDNHGADPKNHFPEMPVARHFLEREGRRLDSFSRRFIEEACAQPYSFFVIAGVEPGKSLTLKDVLLDRTVKVAEKTATEMLQEGQIIYSRVITLDDVSIMLGCGAHLFPPSLITPLMNFKHTLEDEFRRITPQLLHDLDGFTRSMYRDIHKDLSRPQTPQLTNTDGEPLEPTKLIYDLKCSPQEALEALATLCLLPPHEMREATLFDVEDNLKAIRFPWQRKGNKANPMLDNTVLGEISINEDRLTIEVNSRQRAEAIKRKITRRLGRRAVFRNAVIESMDQVLERLKNAPPHEPRGEDPMERPEVQALVREMAEKHWKEWLDTPLPALNGQTPREAAGDKRGRELLEALLLQFEHRGEPQPFDPDVDALRKELGLEK